MNRRVTSARSPGLLEPSALMLKNRSRLHAFHRPVALPVRRREDRPVGYLGQHPVRRVRSFPRCDKAELVGCYDRLGAAAQLAIRSSIVAPEQTHRSHESAGRAPETVGKEYRWHVAKPRGCAARSSSLC